ncbi:unnamed protein product [Adineta ricciae]|uniref:MACPF domain-containing protein n=1 Tax=Adineta ricciae TaxID=249248 RepID=A0A815E8F3_ADIRI|nr:unnamed protein product [Adineta ricciae]
MMHFYFYWLLIFARLNVAITNRLPGLDELMSGFDAAKMVSGSDQQSKFRILDLSEQSGVNFTLDVDGQKQTFSTPLLAQVTDISLRREVGCEDISYSFEKFYESHFRSNSFQGGISVAGYAGLAVQYSETLKRAQEAITKHNQAVGTSTLWWGLYSMQLAPSFQLKVDQMFNASINILLQQASPPTTEDQQRLYNQFVESYGTHYVSKVIMGGTAYVYSFINSSYYSTANTEETSQQIGLMFEYKKYQGQGSIESAEVFQKITETFKTSTSVILEYHPPVNVNNEDNQTEWNTWLLEAGQHPVVVNRTLTHLAELIISSKAVQTHLRTTIDYYITNGKLPTLAQIQSRAAVVRLSSSDRKPLGPLAGLDVVGCGFDVLLLESKLCVLDQTNTSEGELWFDPYNDTIAYSLPNGFFATNTPEKLLLDVSVLVTSVQDYFRLTTTTTSSSSGGVLGIGRKHTETTVTDFYRRFYHDYYSLVLRLIQIGWYKLSTNTFPYPRLTPLAQRAIDQLPSVFNENQTNVWEQFFASYGTHLVESSNMGGLVWAETWYEQCLTYEHTETWIDEQVSRSFVAFSTHSSSQDHMLEIDEKFKQFSIFSSQILGGTESVDPTKWKEWQSTIKFNPRPISYQLVTLDKLLPEGNKRTALNEAIQFYLKTAVEEDRTYINKLEADRDPLPPTKCSRNAINNTRGGATVHQNADRTIEETEETLCDYVGYKGKLCLQRRQTTNATDIGYNKLFLGVGMTFDIITGDILRPALKYTYSNITFWTDSFTNRQYFVPKEVSFPLTVDNDSVPVAHVFLTATELSNRWRYDRLQGDWLGGEFGHSQSLLNIYKKYFSSDESVAITQHPTVLYRMRVENFQLNDEARAATDALTPTYNESLYSDFLREWGTHIVQQSLVGGMHEQHVLFKDCVFSFNNAITSANLAEYLKQDILRQTLGNDFYANRRQVKVDHLLGGDVTLSNYTLWRESIIANPALLKIESYTPWYEVATLNDAVKGNLRRIIQRQTREADLARARDEATLNKNLLNQNLEAKKAYIGLLNDGTCSISGPITLESVPKCINGCSTPISINSTIDVMESRPLEYFRDSETGFVRARLRINAQTTLDGPRVHIGCSSISTPAMLTQSVHICVKCELISSFANQCACVCPSYPPLVNTTAASPTL